MRSPANAKANDAVRRIMDEAIGAGDEIGVAVCAYLGGAEIVNQWAGLADETSGARVGADTLFNVYSVSKAITATALHLQAERGLVDYDAPVARYWPEFAARGKEHTTVRHIITHSSGIPQMPPGTSVEDMCDWDLMVARLADLEPVAPPGAQATYQALNHGWLVGEIVRRTDSANRSFGQFVRDEIGDPLNAPDLWIGVADEVAPRIAKLRNDAPLEVRTGLHAQAMPMNLSLVPDVFERPDVRAAEIASVGGIFSAQSCARVWAMLANGGELDGVRLLSADRVASFNQPRRTASLTDAVLMGRQVAISEAGYWLGGPGSPTAIYHPGAGGSIAWAELDTGLAVAFCHNKMSRGGSSPIGAIAAAIRESLQLA
jgi:CubicO group peptidase (beta-lactamase class C family)